MMQIRPRSNRRNPNRRRLTQAVVECLEARCLLSTTLTVNDGNQFIVNGATNALTVSNNGTFVETDSLAGVTTLSVSGLSGGAPRSA